MAAVRADPRWVSESLEEEEDGVLLGALQVSWPRRPGVPTGLLGTRIRAALGPAEVDRVLVAGGATRYVGGGLVRARTDPWSTVTTLQKLTNRAAALACEQDAALVALSVPHDQVLAFQQSWGPTTKCAPGHLWASLQLGEATTVDEFVSALPKQARYNWRRDAEQIEAAGLVLTREPWDGDLLDEAASHVADVSRRNGVADDPMMVRWRLDQWREQTIGDHLCLTARDDGRLVGTCFVRVSNDVVDAFEVGLHPEHPDRHTIYAALVFRGTVALAVDFGLGRVELGIGHPYPKGRRGATLTRLWDITAVR